MKSGDVKKIFEYALILDVKRKREEYADFIRALTPLFMDLFEIILKKKGKINLDDYCIKRKNGSRKWDKKKIEGTEIKNILLRRRSDFNFNIEVSSLAVTYLIEGICDNKQLVKVVTNLRSVEENIRNLAAHQIVSVTEDKIKQLTGFSSERIMEMIKSAFEYAGMNIKPEDWNSYEEMNKLIVERMES